MLGSYLASPYNRMTYQNGRRCLGLTWHPHFMAGTTKFIHLCSRYAILYDCVRPSGESSASYSCAVDEAGVEILSRTPTVSLPAMNSLKDVIRQTTCVDVNKMVDLLSSGKFKEDIRMFRLCVHYRHTKGAEGMPP